MPRTRRVPQGCSATSVPKVAENLPKTCFFHSNPPQAATQMSMEVADGYASNSTTSTQKLWNFLAGVAGVPGVGGFARGLAAESTKFTLAVGYASEGRRGTR